MFEEPKDCPHTSSRRIESLYLTPGVGSLLRIDALDSERFILLIEAEEDANAAGLLGRLRDQGELERRVVA